MKKKSSFPQTKVKNPDQFKKDENSLADLKLAIELKSNFLKSEFFNNYNDAIVKTRVLSSLDAQDYFTETILEILKKNFNTNELFKITTDELHEKLISSLTKEPILNIFACKAFSYLLDIVGLKPKK